MLERGGGGADDRPFMFGIYRYAVSVVNKLGNRVFGGVDFNRNGEMRELLKIIKSSGAGEFNVLDVGANGGHWARSALSLDGRVRCFCFEPIRPFFERIERSDPRLRAFNVGLGERDETLFAYQSGGGGSLIEEKQSKGKENARHSVEIKNGDEFVSSLGLGDVGFVKVDVDGTEIRVLRGLAGTIGKFQPAVQFEFGYYNYLAGDSFYKYFKFFKNIGYDVFCVTRFGISKIKRYKYMASEIPINLNYLAVPGGRKIS